MSPPSVDGRLVGAHAAGLLDLGERGLRVALELAAGTAVVLLRLGPLAGERLGDVVPAASEIAISIGDRRRSR